MGIKSLSNSSGIVNFQKYQSFLAGTESNQVHHLETVRLSGTTASVTFTNLEQYRDYQHLQIRAVHRSNDNTSSNTANAGFWIRYNNDSGSNYSWHRLEGSGSSVTSGAGTGQTWGLIGITPRVGQTANGYGATLANIFDPFESTKNTTFQSFMANSTSTFYVAMHSGAWLSTAPVTSISLFPDSSGSFILGSRFSLYGMKARR